MSGRILLDTNTLVYLYDPLDATKQDRAIETVNKLVRTTRAVISTQVLGEFFAATTRARRPILSPAEAIASMRNYLAVCEVLDVTQFITLEALRGVETYSFGFWDAQIWATARLNQISEIYSEDFNVGAVIEGVRFTNPLTEDFRI
jgi:predicted nucleic acid-binding protein